MDTKIYPSNLTDEQWQLLELLLPPAKPGGRPRTTDIRQVVNGIVYLVRSGCSWRMLPHDFPPRPAVHDYYRKYRRDGIWNQIYEMLHERVRLEAGRQASPSAAIIDSQTVKTASKGGIAVMTPARK
jgi:putative transposase